EASGDHIYGVIRGTAENHGGRAASLTAPNPKAQADLLLAAYRQAGIDPTTVTYIETHGTGTSLGDPIEINGLKSAFKTLYQDTGEVNQPERRCGLGSVKSNIGHLELAAGVAGVIKVLLQMKHRKLVKSLHCETVNPYIQLKDSPFYIVQEEEEWKALEDKEGNVIPRRAGVSSFGFGGANAHVVIEEYVSQTSELVKDLRAEQPVVIILSARNAERLNEQARLLLEAIQRGSIAESELERVAYTLQVGREAMDERLGFTVTSVQELENKLRAYVEGNDESTDLYKGQARSNREAMALIGGDEDWQTVAQAWMNKGKYDKLLAFWSKGLSVDWNGLYVGNKPIR
ncbi:ketoacyl-synthetase C-terminal extension domain-containing protein, partial [Bacillus thuringiensis]|uniref:KS-MAT linker domain-containing protein n=1 Tax=Bacillus thuringiensis TaxID=1428 RepID=UPI00115980F9